MPVLLRTSQHLPEPDKYHNWLAVGGTSVALPTERRIPKLAERLEQAFTGIRETWWALGKALGSDPTARWAQMPTAGSYGSDFGLMLAWSDIVQECAGSANSVLVVCDDPWVFRHITKIPGVLPGRAPALWPRRLKLAIRGWLSRGRYAFRVAAAAVLLRSQRRHVNPGAPTLIVYGHPASTAEGKDAYFGTLMEELPTLQRVLHVDCHYPLAETLASRQRTASLHAWGSLLFAFALVLTLWRPSLSEEAAPYCWLVRRAAARENGGGGPAATRWQIHCQAAWIKACRPSVVVWPWENHAWERSLCRQTRRSNTQSIGYQHTVIGPHQFNFSPATNVDGPESLPDRILCNGPAYRLQLEALGISPERLGIGGTFRISRFSSDHYDTAGPVYVALSAIRAVSEKMMAAITPLASQGTRFVFKEHPLYPMGFPETKNVRRTDDTIPDSQGVSAVLYSTGTTGLEAMLAGIPTYRFQPDDSVALDVLPDGFRAVPVTVETLAPKLATGSPPEMVWTDVMAPVALEVWKDAIGSPAMQEFRENQGNHVHPQYKPVTESGEAIEYAKTVPSRTGADTT